MTILTEAEANKHDCPFIQRRDQAEGQEKCLASACIAWRWSDDEARPVWRSEVGARLLIETGKWEACELQSENFNTSGKMKVCYKRSLRRGYCGACGKP